MRQERTSICPVCQNPFHYNSRTVKRTYCSKKCYGITLKQKKLNTAKDFWARVDKDGPNGCWVWKGGIGPTGYGYFYWHAKSVLAHRLAYELLHGPIPEGLDCLHHCDNRPCVNAEQHLFLGTNLDNVLDRMSKGRPTGVPAGDNHPNAKLTFAKADEIRKLFSSGSYSVSALARMYSLGKSTIGRVIANQTWVKS